MMLLQGSLGVGKDPGSAVKLLVTAVDAGYLPAQIDYAQVLAQDALGIPTNTAKAEVYFRNEADGAETGKSDSGLPLVRQSCACKKFPEPKKRISE